MTYDPVTFTQTREIGFFERIGGSLLGIPLGIILIFFPMSLLWWNESRNVDAQKAIELALDQVVTVPAAPVLAQNNDRLVHVIGAATATGVTDAALGVSLPGVVVAQRRVAMYQWRERQSQQTNTNWGGSQTVTTTFSYDKVWSSEGLDSHNFRQPQGHSNPPMPARSAQIPAEDAKLGGFRLGATTLAALGGSLSGGDSSSTLVVDFAPKGATFPAPPAGFEQIRPQQVPSGFTADPAGGMYRGRDPNAPSIGDVRVSYVGVLTGRHISVVARQSAEGFTDFPLMRGYTLQLATVGEHSAAAMLDARAAQESTLTWILRVVGVVVMWIGFMLLLGPLGVLVSVVPVLGGLVDALSADIAFVLAVMLGSLTIAVAWLFVHPLVSLGLILSTLMVGGAYLYVRQG